MRLRVALLVAGLIVITTLASSSANSGVYIPLKVPQAEDIDGFTMGESPATGTVIRTTKADLVDFLRHAKNNLEVESWQDLKVGQPDSYELTDQHCEGVFTDKKGRFYFWCFYSPTVLTINAPDGGGYALLQLEKN